MGQPRTTPFPSGISPWQSFGAVAVLLLVIASWTVTPIKRQETQGVRLTMAKEAALARSFEARTRMGMRGGHDRRFQLKRLLIETAAQPDVGHQLVLLVGCIGMLLPVLVRRLGISRKTLRQKIKRYPLQHR